MRHGSLVAAALILSGCGAGTSYSPVPGADSAQSVAARQVGPPSSNAIAPTTFVKSGQTFAPSIVDAPLFSAAKASPFTLLQTPASMTGNNYVVDSGGYFWYTLTAQSEIIATSSTGSYQIFGTTPPKGAYWTGTAPTSITLGSDGNIWYADAPGAVGRITSSGADREFFVDKSDQNRFVNSITSGPDGNLWFTTYDCSSKGDAGGDKIGRITTSGKVTLFPLHTKCNDPVGITPGPDGNLWFTESGESFSGVGRITTGGAYETFKAPQANLYPQSIITGPDGNLWVADSGYNGTVSVISPYGQFLKQYSDPHQSAVAYNLTVGSDGNVWVSESGVTKNTFTSGLGRITTSGKWTDYTLKDSNEIPFGITAQSNQIWFSIYGRGGKLVDNGIGYLTI